MKQFSYMLHTIFHYAPGESAAYLAAEIMSCLISFLQLILLQSVVDSFLQNSLGSGIWQGVLFLGIYFLFQVLIQNGKERLQFGLEKKVTLATVYKGNIIKNLIMDCQSYTKYRPNETTGGIFVSWRRKEELPTGA